MDQIHHCTMQSLSQCDNSPHVRIVEQPAADSLRFRYECEGRSAGSIVGTNSTPDNRTYPTIQVMNYQGPFAIVVSIVTKDGPPYRPHPHNLVGREGCKRGVCTLLVNNADMTYSFTGIGIQCVKRKDIERSLRVRAEHKIDPFSTGFSHRTQPGFIDLNVVRLCFQVFIKGPDNAFTQPLQPVVSDPIYDKKAMSDLSIVKLSHYAARVDEGKEVIMLCAPVVRDNIQVWFYEEELKENDVKVVTWEAQADFQPNDVHKKVAICFKTPRYHNLNIEDDVTVFIELRQPSDNKKGEPKEFTFYSLKRDPEGLARKRAKIENMLSLHQGHHPPIAIPRLRRQSVKCHIKKEAAQGALCELFPGVIPLFPIQPATLPPHKEVVLPLHSNLTPSHSPSQTMSPDAHSYSSSFAPSPTGMLTMMTAVGISHPQIICHSFDDVIKQSSPHQQFQAPGNPVDGTVIEKLDSLGLIDSGDLLKDFNMNLPDNLSTSMFDSTNILIDSPLQQSLREQEYMMQNELEKLCQNTGACTNRKLD